MQVVKVSPAEVERRVDDIFAAAIDRGLDAVARQEFGELRETLENVVDVVNTNARALLEACERLVDLEATAVRIQPELLLAEPVDGVAFEDVAHEPLAVTRQRHFGTHLQLIKENHS